MTDVRVAVLGVGAMGADHVARLTERVPGARVSVVCDALDDTAERVAAVTPGTRVVADPLDAIVADDVDAVILATPGPSHAEQVMACLDAGRPVLCEKPLTTEPASAYEIVRREAELGKKLVQVGFMRRFDGEYIALRARIAAGEFGTPLMVHCIHRNVTVPSYFDSRMVVADSLVHEVDATRFLLGEEIVAVTVNVPASSPDGRPGLQDPQFTLFETSSGVLIDAEVFVTSGVAYEVRAEVVGDRGSAMIGYGRTPVPLDFRERFTQAYDNQLWHWIEAVRTGRKVDGPGAWDGYAAAAVSAAGVQSLATGERVSVEIRPRP